jgi:hypothetical protein
LVFPALDIHEPDLASLRMLVAAMVEHAVSGRAQLRFHEGTTLGTGEYVAVVDFEVVA